MFWKKRFMPSGDLKYTLVIDEFCDVADREIELHERTMSLRQWKETLTKMCVQAATEWEGHPNRQHIMQARFYQTMSILRLVYAKEGISEPEQAKKTRSFIMKLDRTVNFFPRNSEHLDNAACKAFEDEYNKSGLQKEAEKCVISAQRASLGGLASALSRLV